MSLKLKKLVYLVNLIEEVILQNFLRTKNLKTLK